MEESNRVAIKYWAEEDRPREKLLIKGKSALSNAELLAILIGSGSKTTSAVELSKQILRESNDNLNELAKLTVSDLLKFGGVGEAKAITIVSALELGRRRKPTDQQPLPMIKSSTDAYELMIPELIDQRHEEFWLILLKRNNAVLKKVQLSKGGVSGTVVDTKMVFKHALDELASSVILVHNHPSGSSAPSQADIKLTKKLKSAGEIMDVPILDHIIFCNHSYYSFADETAL